MSGQTWILQVRNSFRIVKFTAKQSTWGTYYLLGTRARPREDTVPLLEELTIQRARWLEVITRSDTHSI